MNPRDLGVHVDTPLFMRPRPLPVRWLFICNQIGVLPAAVALIHNHSTMPDGTLDVRWPSFGPYVASEIVVLNSLWTMQMHGLVRYRLEPGGRILVKLLFRSLGQFVRWDNARWDDEPWRRSSDPR